MAPIHILLTLLWICYCALHSFLARQTVKNYIKVKAGGAFKYYRPAYSLFAFASLAFLLWFQFSIPGTNLFVQPKWLYITALFLGITGLCIMIICINKYFYELSGLQAIHQPGATNTLQQTGLHKFVRHPLYLGTLLFIWALFAIFPLVANAIAVSVITIYVLVGIKLEEVKLREEYGRSYENYQEQVPMLFPALRFYKRKGPDKAL